MNRVSVLERLLRARIQSIHRDALALKLYYLNDKKWFDVDGIEFSDKKTKTYLEQAKRHGFYRPPGEKSAYLWVGQFESVVCIDFPRVIRKSSRDSVARTIDQISQDAANEYFATHDSLTGLRNRRSFDQWLLEKVGSSDSSSRDGESDIETILHVTPSTYLLSLDVDHFKNINDRFGHGYGDVVLAALSWRLENFCKNQKLGREDEIAMDAFRLGGEEFQILVHGRISESEVVDCAEQLRKLVSDYPLPSATEFRALSARDFASEIALPHDGDRVVTVSVGVCSAQVDSTATPVEAANRMKRQADIALYSAKVGGRNRVRYFSEILQKHGRISAVDSANGVIAIDIGKEIGVKKGQEFFVYPPSYDGVTSFYVGEGRSKRRVGIFPRFCSARIVAFDVQQEVSFCRSVQREDGVLQIPEGSLLEAIPLGSIAHLLSGLHRQQGFVTDQEIRKLLRKAEGGFALVAVSVQQLEELSEERGLDHANQCLASAGQELVSKFLSSAQYGQVNVNTFVAIAKCESREEAENAANEIFERVKGRLGEECKFGAGWLFKPDNDMPKDLELASDFGGFLDAVLLSAATPLGIDDLVLQLREFDSLVVRDALFRSRVDRELVRAKADYDLFVGLGVNSAQIENQIGLLYLTNQLYSPAEAEVHLRRAVEFADAFDMIKGNLACFLIATSRSIEGFEIIRDLERMADYEAARFYGAAEVLDADEFKRYVVSRIDEAHAALGGEQRWLSQTKLARIRSKLRQALADL
jgi:diguanylate cyclase (GGDEF)-like protein